MYLHPQISKKMKIFQTPTYLDFVWKRELERETKSIFPCNYRMHLNNSQTWHYEDIAYDLTKYTSGIQCTQHTYSYQYNVSMEKLGQSLTASEKNQFTKTFMYMYMSMNYFILFCFILVLWYFKWSIFHVYWYSLFFCFSLCAFQFVKIALKTTKVDLACRMRILVSNSNRDFY